MRGACFGVLGEDGGEALAQRLVVVGAGGGVGEVIAGSFDLAAAQLPEAGMIFGAGKTHGLQGGARAGETARPLAAHPVYDG